MTRKMKWLMLCALLAGASPEHVLDDDTLLMDPRDDVLVVTVRKVDDAKSTNANPPKVEIAVDEVLRGKPAPSATAWSVWRPIPHDVDYSGGESEKLIGQWSAQELKGPKVGAKMIVKGQWGGTPPVLDVSPRCRYDFDAARRAWAVEVIARPPPATEEEPPEPESSPAPSATPAASPSPTPSAAR
jgi:hypothetical protein